MDLNHFLNSFIKYFYYILLKECQNLNQELLEIFEEGLNVEKNFFVQNYSESFNTLRILHYPPSDEYIKAGEHSDYVFFSVNKLGNYYSLISRSSGWARSQT